VGSTIGIISSTGSMSSSCADVCQKPMSDVNLVYVSAFMEVADRPALGSDVLEGYVDNFIKMAETGIPIVLYICPLYYDNFGHRLSVHPNVECITASTAETWTHRTFQEHPYVLPTGRSPGKDSLGYITLQHSKIEWVVNALYHRPQATHAAWIDFRLPYVFKSPAESLAQLKALGEGTWLTEASLYIPGCIARKPFAVDQLQYPQWRFCGGFFLGSRTALFQFWNLTVTHLPTWLNSYSVASWEVNFWAWLEGAGHGWSPIWYAADHNDSMVNIHVPPQAITVGYTPTPLPCEPIPDMNAMNTSYVKYRGLHLLNIRYVNYRIDYNGMYSLSFLKTQNRTAILDNSCCPSGIPRLVGSPFLSRSMEPSFDIPSSSSTIQGLEDIRLFDWRGVLYALGTQRQWSPCARNRMLLAVYDPPSGRIHSPLLLQSPVDAACEKNWIPVVRNISDSQTLDIIYRWNPYSVGHLDPQGNLLIHTLKEYPALKGLKGSAVPVLYRDALWTLVHRSEGRSYIHSFVLLDPETLLPKAKTQEFVFESAGIEYCIGFTIEDNCADANGLFWYTVQDRDPRCVRLPMCLFKPVIITEKN
jgi:hypothetical protein